MSTSKFNVSIDQIDTFDSIYSDFSIFGSKLLVKWSKIAIFDHPINTLGARHAHYIDMCFLELLDLCLVLKNSNLIFNSSKPKMGLYDAFYLEGSNIISNDLDSYEFFCKQSSIILPEGYKISSDSWKNRVDFIEKKAKPFLLT